MKKEKKKKPKPWEVDRGQPTRSYTEDSWSKVARWIQANIERIKKHGTAKASYVCEKSVSSFPKYMEEEGWTILIGASPTKEQIEECMRANGIK